MLPQYVDVFAGGDIRVETCQGIERFVIVIVIAVVDKYGTTNIVSRTVASDEIDWKLYFQPFRQETTVKSSFVYMAHDD